MSSLQDKILDVLADGKPRTIDEISKMVNLDRFNSNVTNALGKLFVNWQLIGKEYIKGSRVKVRYFKL